MPTTICIELTENVEEEVGAIFTIEGAVLRIVQVTAIWGLLHPLTD